MVRSTGMNHTIITVCIFCQILLFCPLVKADPARMDCPADRVRTPEEWLVGATSYKINVLRQHAGVTYAGDEDNPRPLPKRTIVDFSRRAQRYHPQSRSVVWFSFFNDTMKFPYPEAVPTQPKEFWCLVQPGDIVLLSDGITHHFTIVSHTDRKSGRIFFVDPWPDRFFLLQGMNTVDAEADISSEPPAVAFSSAPATVHQQINMQGILDILSQDPQSSDPMPDWYTAKAKLVSITRPVFERVILGLSTPASAELLDYCLKLNPSRANDFKFYRGFGLTTLEAGNQFSRESAASFEKARTLMKASGQSEEELFLASRQYLALVLTHHSQQAQRADSTSASGTILQLGALEKEYGGKSLIKDYSSKDLVRLGNAAGSAGDLDRAKGWLDAAITTHPRDAAAYLYRSTTKLRMRSLDGTENDVSIALVLLAEEEKGIRVKAAKVDRRAVDEWQDLGADLTDILDLKSKALQQRATLSFMTNKCEQAISDINDLGKTLAALRRKPSDSAKNTIAVVQDKCSSK